MYAEHIFQTWSQAFIGNFCSIYLPLNSRVKLHSTATGHLIIMTFSISVSEDNFF
jgi:hypothetical protein